MENSERERILRIANTAIDEAERWLSRHRRDRRFLSIQHKENQEEVTEADRVISRIVSQRLRSLDDHWAVVSEEEHWHGRDNGSYWLLDPIDGTMNFARQSPIWTVSLAFVVDDTPFIGVVAAPDLGYRSSQQVRPTRRPFIADVDLAAAIVGISGTGSSLAPGAETLLATVRTAAHRIRIHGSMSFDLVAVSHGWLNACICLDPDPWDVAAGIALVQSTGRAVLGPNADDYNWGSRFLVAGPRGLATHLSLIISSFNE
jgi:myo-inositol-1(or 4)-monophosphatase